MKKENNKKKRSFHWADINAEKIIREKGEKDIYVCASGITPSGTVHIGNFREIISVDLVARSLREMGRNVRFIYSWDDYDVFRKVPVNMPSQEELKKHLRKPITSTPDPYGKEESYARHNEKEVEDLLPVVGINPEFIYQSKQYRSSVYAEEMKTALEKKDSIINILNEHRTTPLPDDWSPVSIFCSKCLKDTTEIKGVDSGYKVSYHCESCDNKEQVDLRETSCCKLFWRIDWPMRWKKEGVDFEPAGKDHHSEGGSFDTAKKIAKEIYSHEPPVTFQYDFISIKGRGGKISSSSGEVVSLKDVLDVYQPEIVRYMFAGTRPNSEFSISFDLDVIKIYEDYDKCERIFYGIEQVSEKRLEKEKRIYELSQVNEVPEYMTKQFGFRHLCNLLQIHNGNIDNVFEYMELKDIKDFIIPASIKSERLKVELDEKDFEKLLAKVRTRAKCAWNWITQFAPENFRFQLRPEDSAHVEITDKEKQVLTALEKEVDNNLDRHNEQSLSEAIYSISQELEIQPKDIFKLMYRILIGKEMGPRLAGFMLIIGKDRLLKQFRPYI